MVKILQFRRFSTSKPSPQHLLCRANLEDSNEGGFIEYQPSNPQSSIYEPISPSNRPVKTSNKRNQGLKKNSHFSGSVNIYPDILNKKFESPVPNTFWSVDFHYLKTVVEEDPKARYQIFAILDLGNGQVVGWDVFKNPSSADLVETITPLIKINQAKQEYLERDVNPFLVIHSDKGEVFRSNLYRNLEAIFSRYLFISHSPGLYPTENSPIERL